MGALSGKAVVVTGSGSGLGAAYARHAARHGASVIVNDVDKVAAARTAEEIAAEGGHAFACPGDVAVWGFADALVEACVQRFGGINGFVNNAGILRPAMLDAVTEAELRRMFEVNFLGTAAGAIAAVGRLRRQGRGGSIVNVASGSQAGDVGLGGYGATKAAVASLTYSWAMELRGTGIRMNAISPLAETAMAGQNAHLMAIQGAHREVRYSALPPPDNNAPVVSFLLSDASASINGQLIRIAGQALSYVTHPAIAEPVLVDDWTLEKVEAAFARTLADRQQKLGLAYSGKISG